MIIRENYQILRKNNIYYVSTDEAMMCPVCGGQVKVRDSKRRSLIMEDGSVCIFRLRRLQCQSCGFLHQELPDIMCPNKHYAAAVIASAVDGSRDDCPADNSTIARWVQEARELQKKEEEKNGEKDR